MTDTDGWTLREWADHAVGQLPTVYLERYVEAFEAGTLQVGNPADCAVGHMMCGPEGYNEYDEEVRCCEFVDTLISRHGIDAPPLVIIEAVFEGFFPCHLRNWRRKTPERATTLYDSCIEELARRAGAKVEDLKPTEQPTPV